MERNNMERTPKLSRKAMLGASRRNSDFQFTSSTSAPRSPSISSDDIGIDMCTPPHKNRFLDESYDYSPKVFDSSFSPTALFSQTMAMESPEVQWQWAPEHRRDSDNSTATPDSAYAADSSFTSAGSNSIEVGDAGGSIGRSLRPRRCERRREEQRKALEMELRRTEKARAEEKLKQRCAKLQEQLKDAATQKRTANDKENENKRTQKTHSEPSNDLRQKVVVSDAPLSNCEQPFVGNDTLDDFLNDSDSDYLLVAATQQIESALVESSSQKPLARTTTTSNTTAEVVATPRTSNAKGDLRTPTSSANEKRSSLYMKFLEDDITDDWFQSLDEVILQATQTKKPRTSTLQRYKSMPAATTTTTTTSSMTTRAMNLQCIEAQQDAPATVSDCTQAAKMKRHASTHSLSPSSASYRGRMRLRK